MYLTTLCLSILFSWPSAGDAFTIRYSATRYQSKSALEEQKTSFICKCDGVRQVARMSNKEMEKVFWTLQNALYCDKNTISKKVCWMLKECEDCWATMIKCTFNQTSGDNCLKKEIGIFPEHRNSDLGSGDVLKRNVRQINVCRFPEGLEHSHLYVTHRPNSITIIQKCIFGYTLEEGITLQMDCNFDENQWKPRKFDDCRPFIDCTFDLISAGFATCNTATIDDAPDCSLSCASYEDRPAVEEKEYKCKIDGTWEPELPYCATSGSGIRLVPVPGIKVHSAEKPSTVRNIKRKKKPKQVVHHGRRSQSK